MPDCFGPWLMSWSRKCQIRIMKFIGDLFRSELPILLCDTQQLPSDGIVAKCSSADTVTHDYVPVSVLCPPPSPFSPCVDIWVIGIRLLCVAVALLCPALDFVDFQLRSYALGRLEVHVRSARCLSPETHRVYQLVYVEGRDDIFLPLLTGWLGPRRLQQGCLLHR